MESWTLSLHAKAPRTVRHYLDEVRRFVGWLVANDRPAPGDLLALVRVEDRLEDQTAAEEGRLLSAIDRLLGVDTPRLAMDAEGGEEPGRGCIRRSCNAGISGRSAPGRRHPGYGGCPVHTTCVWPAGVVMTFPVPSPI